MTTGLRWIAEHADEGGVAFRIGRDGDELVAEWVGVARLVAHRDGSRASLYRDPGASSASFDKVRLGSARLLLRHLAGELALHGAAVARDGIAVVLLGRSGLGKSTLAAHLCANGAALLADDAVALDPDDTGGYAVAPFESHHWLTPSARLALGLAAGDGSRADKSPVLAASVARQAAPLRAFVDLSFEPVATPELRRLSPMAAVSALIPQVARFILDEPAVQRAELEALAGVVEQVPIFGLVRPRGFEHLCAAQALIEPLFR